MRLVKLYIIVLCWLCKTGTAQVYFNNRYDLFTRADVSNTVFYNHGQYFVPCGGLDITQSNLSLSVLQVDLNGTITNSSHYFKSNNWFYSAQIGKINPLNDSLLLYIGTRIGSGSSKTYTYWFKNTLDSVRYKEYGFATKENYINKYSSDGGKYIYQVGYVDSSNTNTDILLIKIDTAGNEIWTKKIGLTGWDESGWSIKTCVNGDLLISGLKDLRNSPQQGPFIMRLDSSGTVLWQNYYPSPNYANPGYDVKELPNGDIVFTGGIAYSGTGPNGYTKRKPTLTRLDSSGNLIWQKEYGAVAEGHDFFTFLINERNNFVISGCKFYPGNSCVGMVYEINQNGDSLFSREFTIEPGSQNYFRDIVQAPDGGYVFAGFLIPLFANGGTGTQDIWLLKTDSTFCESNMSCGYPTGVAGAELFETGGVGVYPNPTTGLITITCSNYNPEKKELLSITGQVLLTEKGNSKTLQLNLQNFSEGIYFVRVTYADGLSVTKKIIKL